MSYEREKDSVAFVRRPHGSEEKGEGENRPDYGNRLLCVDECDSFPDVIPRWRIDSSIPFLAEKYTINPVNNASWRDVLARVSVS